MAIREILLLAAVSSLALGGTQATHAQEDVISLDEIVVISQKRVQSLQDVPISIAAVSGEQLVKKGIADFSELSAHIPNVTITQEQIADRISIRGIASGGNQGFDQSVGLFSSGVYLARGTQFRSAFLDVGAVEILRGPQATLFGRNTIAGAVNMTPNKPTDIFEAEVRGGYEAEYGSYDMMAVLSGPLSDTLRARAAVKYTEGRGYVENTITGVDEPNNDSLNYRVSLQWDASENLTIDMSHEAYEMDQKYGKGFEVNFDEAVAPVTGAATPRCTLAAFGGECDFNYTRHTSTVDGTAGFTSEEYSEVDTSLTTMTINYSAGEYTITSVTGYAESELKELNAGNHVPIPLTLTEAQEKYNQFSQELRIVSPTGEKFEWISGIYYEKSDIDFEDNILVNNGFILTPFGIPTSMFGFPDGTNLNIHTDFGQETEVLGAFVQGTYSLSDTVRVTGGLRFSNEKKEAQQKYSLLNPADGTRLGDAAAGLYGFVFNFNEHDTGLQKRSSSKFSPSLNFQWDASDETLAYASVSRGYKSGGFDARLSTSNDPFEFNDERATTFEVGFKQRFLEGRAELNTAIFHTKYNDLQFSAYNGGLSFFVANAANAKLKGIEFEGRFQATESLILSGGAAYLDFEYQNFQNGPCDIYLQLQTGSASASCATDLSGRRAPNTPEFTLNLNADWSTSLTNNILLNIGGSVMYESSYYVSQDLDERLKQEGYAKLDLRASLMSADDIWSLTLLAKNVTNKATFHYGDDVPLTGGTRFIRPDVPRTIKVELGFRF